MSDQPNSLTPERIKYLRQWMHDNCGMVADEEIEIADALLTMPAENDRLRSLLRKSNDAADSDIASLNATINALRERLAQLMAAKESK